MATRKGRKGQRKFKPRRTARRQSTMGSILPPFDVRSKGQIGELMKRITKGPLTIMLVYADWCGPCRMIAPILEKVAVKLNGKATVLKVNTDEAGQAATQLRITSIPTMIIYKEGKEVSRHVGIKDEKGLISWVESHL